jgi:hypothetical protein
VFRRAVVIALGVLTVSIAYADEPLPLRDPMQPYRAVAGVAGGGGAGPRFALTAVLISPLRRVAIVNGKPYERGDTVDGAEIVRIEADAVHLRERGNELVVPLGRVAATAARKNQGETAQ